jgi:hypothetical protein
MNNSTPVRLLVVIILMTQLTACDYGLIGKKTAAKVDNLDATVATTVDKARDSVMDYLVKTRVELLNYLRNNSTKEAHDLSVGIMQGVIGYLDSAQNRDNLALFFDSVITHVGSAARIQLIGFKDQLLDPAFIGQTQVLLRGVMRELLIHPADNLLNLALADHTRNQLDKMLQMAIPALLNDRAIDQVARLRNTLLGQNMKRDIASWVDTALLVANFRLDSTLRPTIHKIVDDNTSTIRKNANWIITGLVALIIVVGLVVYFVQRKKVLLQRSLLRQVTLQIERLKRTAPDHYTALTTKIKDAMDQTGLEPHMSQFLTDEHIHSN